MSAAAEGFSSPQPALSAKQTLLAAADKIQAHLDVAASMPWRAAEQTHNEWVSIQNDYVALGSIFSGSDAALASLAVNAMPALAAWLRWEAEAACVPEHSHRALDVARQILGGAR